MQLPKLTPLQSRLLAFATTTCLVITLWLCFQPTSFAYAAEIPVPPEVVRRSEFEASIPPVPPDDPPIEIGNDVENSGEALYEPNFAYFDRSLVGRQEADVTELNNNQMVGMDISPNTTRLFRFKKNQLNRRKVLEEILVAQGLEDTSNASSGRRQLLSEEDTEEDALEKRQSRTQLWISANTCKQPTPTVKLVTDPPPQLTMRVWTSTTSTSAQPSSTNGAENVSFSGGYVNYTLSTDQDVFVSVEAPSLTQGWDGNWHFEIAASVDDGYYFGYDNSTNFVYLVDTDSGSTLFITHNLTASNNTDEVSKWTSLQQMPFSIYAFTDEIWSPMMGLEQSACGLREQFEVLNNLTVATNITTNFGLGFPKGQFHVEGLQPSMTYNGFIALNEGVNMTMNGTKINSGGQVFKAFQWTTKAENNCQVIFGLDECSEVAYAVPSNPQFKNNVTGLKALYDNQAKSYMENFRRSLAQVACDTASSAQYSLARNCTDCENDYKNWMCSVLIPRCEDWSADDPWLHPRNINAPFANGTSLTSSRNSNLDFNNTMRNNYAYNQSRNPMIDVAIKPGPYKELLPCEDLCFDIIRSCPAQLGFACPNPPMRELSYGRKDDPRRTDARNLTCSFPGAVTDLNQDQSAAGFLGAQVGTAVVAAVFAAAWAWI